MVHQNGNSEVKMFIEICLEQYNCLLDFNSGRYSILEKRLGYLEKKMKTDGNIDLLTRLYDHKNPKVRFQSAAATLSVSRNNARKVLEKICDMHELPTALYAGTLLDNVDNGIFDPAEHGQ
jgi:hypothetical protein